MRVGAIGVLALVLASAASAGCAGLGGLSRSEPERAGAACTAAPHDTPLFLRGSMNGWAAAPEYALTWTCDAWTVDVRLQGAQDFKISDATWADAFTYGSPDGELASGAAVPVAAQARGGGSNIRYRFDGWQRLSFRADADGASLTARAIPAPPEPDLGPVARSLTHDSRDARHKAPFGAQPAGTEIAFALDAAPGARAVTLVVERRTLEGNQEVLAYDDVARVPLTRRPDGAGERWSGAFRFETPGVYGYWFEVEADGTRLAYQNNEEPIYWTRERGANGLGEVGPLPEDRARVRRFRQTVHAADFAVPEWARDAVWYYVFPERFRNGDPSNDPRPGPRTYQDSSREVHAAWTERPFRAGSGDGSDARHSNDFYGGDLEGIRQKLDYVASLGATAIYMTPIFTAGSNHKYDTADYRQIDPGFGTEAEFRRLTEEAARRGIRVVIDASFNHTGRDSLYFDRYAKYPSLGALEGGEVRADSPYADWYRLIPSAADPDDRYVGWTGAKDLPELNEASADFRRFVFGGRDGVTQRWLDAGAAGWRMDVAPWVPDDFWRPWRQALKAHRPDAVAIAETWFDSSKYFLGDMFDGTMNYVWRNAVLDIAAGGGVEANYRNIELTRELYPVQALQASMNLLSTHDTARSLWLLGDHGDDPDKAAEARRRYRLALFMQATWPGAPTIFYGDEVGVTGGEDPDNRRTYPWPELGGRPDEALLAEVRALIALRRAHPILSRGELGAPLFADATALVVPRAHDGRRALVAVHNGTEARTLTLDLPAEFEGLTLTDPRTGRAATVRDRRLTLTLEPMSGAALIQR